MKTTMVGGVMAMLLLVACGDAATSTEDPGARPANAEGSSASPAPTPSASPSNPSSSSSSPASDDGGSPDAAKPAPADCSKRTGGALVTFEKNGETWTVWVTNAKFNTEALLATAQGKAVTPVFNQVIDGVDCDGQFTWHVDADDVAWEADYDVSCDALPSTIEANKAPWIASGRWCPSKVLVSSFQSY